MIASGLEGLWDAVEDASPVVSNRTKLPMLDFSSISVSSMSFCRARAS